MVIAFLNVYERMDLFQYLENIFKNLCPFFVYS